MTCEQCFFWDPQQQTDAEGNCIVEPPRIYPIIGTQAGKPTTVLQNMYPRTPRDQRECRHFDPRPRPLLEIVRKMPQGQ